MTHALAGSFPSITSIVNSYIQTNDKVAEAVLARYKKTMRKEDASWNKKHQEALASQSLDGRALLLLENELFYHERCDRFGLKGGEVRTIPLKQDSSRFTSDRWLEVQVKMIARERLVQEKAKQEREKNRNLTAEELRTIEDEKELAARNDIESNAFPIPSVKNQAYKFVQAKADKILELKNVRPEPGLWDNYQREIKEMSPDERCILIAKVAKDLLAALPKAQVKFQELQQGKGNTPKESSTTISEPVEEMEALHITDPKTKACIAEAKVLEGCLAGFMTLLSCTDDPIDQKALESLTPIKQLICQVISEADKEFC